MLTTGENNIDPAWVLKAWQARATPSESAPGITTATFINGISEATAAGGAAVFVTSNGHSATPLLGAVPG